MIATLSAIGACGGTPTKRPGAAPARTPKPAVRLPDVPPPIAPPAATGDCVPEADVVAYTKALEEHTLTTLAQHAAAAAGATLVTYPTYYIDGALASDDDGRSQRDPSVVVALPGAPFDERGRITVARTPDGTVRLFDENPRHHVITILACGTTCNVTGGAMPRPQTLVFRLGAGEKLGPILPTDVDAWSVYRAALDFQLCYGNSPPP